MVRSQGPSRSAHVALTWPKRLITCNAQDPCILRHMMFEKLPSGVARLPTTTHPPRSTPRAVLKPGSWLEKKVIAVPGGAMGPSFGCWMIVVPVP